VIGDSLYELEFIELKNGHLELRQKNLFSKMLTNPCSEIMVLPAARAIRCKSSSFLRTNPTRTVGFSLLSLTRVLQGSSLLLSTSCGQLSWCYII